MDKRIKSFFGMTIIIPKQQRVFIRYSLYQKLFLKPKACSWEGASLWYPENQEEADTVISYWNSTHPTWWTLNLGISGLLVKEVFMIIDGYTFNVKRGSCYKLHSTPLNWTEAYNVCSAERSYLAMINNWLEVDDLVKLTETAPTNRVAGSYLKGIYHLGFHNRFNEGWQTVKGPGLNESVEWWGNQPDGGCHDQCGSMFYIGRLNQIDCGMKCFFICEHDVDQPSLTEYNEENIAK